MYTYVICLYICNVYIYVIYLCQIHPHFLPSNHSPAPLTLLLLSFVCSFSFLICTEFSILCTCMGMEQLTG